MLDHEKLSDEELAKLLQKCDQLKEEIVSNGESTETRVRLANAYLRLGEREEAIVSLQIGLELNPSTWRSAILSRLRHVCTDEEYASLELPEETKPSWRDVSGLFRHRSTRIRGLGSRLSGRA